MNALTNIQVVELEASLEYEAPLGCCRERDEGEGVFGPLEWLVIAIGQRDGSVGCRSRPLLDALDRLFAVRHPNQLANAGLEQLRRMAALASELGWHVPPSEMSAFLRAGWSEDQLELLIERVAPKWGDGALTDGCRPGAVLSFLAEAGTYQRIVP
ncbi:hypothetical protein [Sphingomonas sp. BK069]|uniref:hypothetical protein n=1 Tax=Sphingomonas sp. BK069 TaxID=2586979 RepID=UPI00161516F7|nr:hypothetical protein [Sphingomonas sp. BK069]MBB3348311.1 hypothetical protein [Sphingomonas sp. BK069]